MAQKTKRPELRARRRVHRARRRYATQLRAILVDKNNRLAGRARARVNIISYAGQHRASAAANQQHSFCRSDPKLEGYTICIR